MLTAIADCCDLTTSAISVHTQDTAKANKAQPRRRWRKPRITPRVIVTTEAGPRAAPWRSPARCLPRG